MPDMQPCPSCPHPVECCAAQACRFPEPLGPPAPAPHAALIARLGHFAAADRFNASQFPEGPVRAGMTRRAEAMEDAIEALGGHAAPLPPVAPPVVGQDEVAPVDEAAGRAAPTRA